MCFHLQQENDLLGLGIFHPNTTLCDIYTADSTKQVLYKGKQINSNSKLKTNNDFLKIFISDSNTVVCKLFLKIYSFWKILIMSQ